MRYLLLCSMLFLFACGEPWGGGECGVPDQPKTMGYCVPHCEVHTHGEKLFKANCSSCHRYSDQKLVGPGLSKYSNNLKAMRKDFKRKCQQGNMPITIAEVDSITLYIGEMKRN